jgi:serine phosphatase RsbU (regulator of sigma subunit)
MRCAYSSITCQAADADFPWHAGGDIAAVVETPDLVRVLIGDVMGHGPKAGETAVVMRRAFRQFAVNELEPPQVIAGRLDRLVAGIDEREDRDGFVTAQLIDVPRGDAAGAEPRMVNCGHPPPLLLRDGRAAFLDAIAPAPPLGLLELAGGARPQPSPLGVRGGDTLLLYTDGVTDARSDVGATYPLAERAATVDRELTRYPGAAQGAALIEALKTGLLAHSGGKLRDDATLMCLQFTVQYF